MKEWRVEEIADEEYEERVLTEVRMDDDGDFVITGDGSSFLAKGKHGIIPKIGDVARYYGRGFGYPVRGLAVNGLVLYYLTEEEQDEQYRRQAEEGDLKKQEEFEESRAELDARYEALPDVFQRRLDRFRAGNPDFRWEYERYELFTCEEALKIATALETADLVIAYGKESYETQAAMVPGLSEDHSGNTHGCAVQLAYLYLYSPNTVVISHGALAPLVGCEEYGCTHPEEPAPRTEVEKIRDLLYGQAANAEAPMSPESSP
jgi:hypothetical protein